MNSNTLLIEWKKKYFETEVFYEDGIINYQEFIKSSEKILFITKEPNSSNHEQVKEPSFITEWNNSIPDYKFAKRISEWSYGILNNFPIFTTASKNAMSESYLKKIALMNLKKTGGGGLSKELDFLELINRVGYIEMIHSQIKSINPEIIILGLSWNSIIDKCFPKDKLNWIETGYSIKVGKFNQARVINFYHPSSWNVPSASYSLLQNVIQSDVYKNL